ncbi:MAG: RluA family pseudouridine synthase [Candidatus Omnitrophica bacterium]|nr:RluA family pseudouridine synthase [Candidatus Omnitrophota bacterium]MDD5236130.1 RluA family pseudouridine synthase [Candidatus Omnitrophota bacterium]MDD5611205.1 RluA family pseudouridine synthase [Candidatus Omnitrophota bacterium]
MRDIPVVYEDEWLLVVNKPAGLLTIPTPKKETHTLAQILNDRLKNSGSAYRLHLCHRLDRDTSGLIIFAKGKSAQKKMMDEFKLRQVKKKYIAFLQGVVKGESGEINKKIDGSSALTRYRVMERRKNFSIVEAIPLSGRKNQLRIHFKSLGHPIVGEDRFAFRKDFALRFKRLCLHAKSLEFRHPTNGNLITLEADLPADLKDFLQRNPE